MVTEEAQCLAPKLFLLNTATARHLAIGYADEWYSCSAPCVDPGIKKFRTSMSEFIRFSYDAFCPLSSSVGLAPNGSSRGQKILPQMSRENLITPWITDFCLVEDISSNRRTHFWGRNFLLCYVESEIAWAFCRERVKALQNI